MPPSSFLWAGEFGGGVGMDVTIDSREGRHVPPPGLRPGSQHSENIRGTVTRKDTAGHGAVLPDAKLDLQRNLVHQGTERLTVGDNARPRPSASPWTCAATSASTARSPACP